MINTNGKRILQILGLGIFFIFIIIYGLFGSHNLIFGVKIKNVNIADGTKVVENVLQVTGNAENAVNITLNGREITINEKGDFDETIALLSGYNIINITAKDKFGYVDEKNYQIIK